MTSATGGTLVPPTVAVTGTAERRVEPDEYVLTATVEVVAGSSAEAYEKVAARAAEVAAAVEGLDVVLERESVNAWLDLGRWRASRSVQVKGRALDRAAEVAGAIGRVGDVALAGPMWTVDRDNPVHDALQADAVHAARARAERYAAALGGGLGPLVELHDTDVRGGYRASSAVALSGSFKGRGTDPGLEVLDLEPVPVELSATVQARWYLDLPA